MPYAEGYLKREHDRHVWRRVVGGLACVVVFCTTYALILPAITLEHNFQCGVEEHVHTEKCYRQLEAAGTAQPELVCTPDSLGIHQHGAECYNDDGGLLCGIADYVLHTHDELCYNDEGTLICPLTEAAEHTHTEGCWAEPVRKLTCGQEESAEGHTHTDACYTTAQPELTCALPEAALHTHSDACYTDGALTCGKLQLAAHQHDDGCFRIPEAVQPELTCLLEEGEGHTHNSLCYGEWELVCGKEEHTHNEACQVIGLINALPGLEEIENTLASFETEQDEEAYLAPLRVQAQEARDAYEALSGELQAEVTNAHKLTELEPLLDAETLESQEESYWVKVQQDGSPKDISVEGTRLSENDTKYLEIIRKYCAQKGWEIIAQRLYQFDLKQGGNPYEYKEGDKFSVGVSYSDNTMPYQDKYHLEVLSLPTNIVDASGIVDFIGVTASVVGNSRYESIGYEYTANRHSAGEVIAFVVVKDAEPALKEEDLPGLGIYPTKEPVDGKGNQWVVYDMGNEETASVRATITLADNKTADSNCYPFIRRVNKGEENYPSDEALKAAVGVYNDAQCYTIHWVKIENGYCNLETGMEFNEGAQADIKLEYLKDEAKLGGPVGERKLKVFALDFYDKTKLVEISDAVQDVVLNSNGKYDGFTFKVTAPCPYVFISKKVEKGYISDVQIASIVDGSKPFDNTDMAGNDSSDDNRIVRSYDTIQYNLEATFAARQAGVTQKSVKMYFELSLHKSATAARFDASKMLWLGENYAIEYLNEQDEVVMVMDHKGGFYEPQRDENGAVVRDESGFALPDIKKPVSINAKVSGSTEGGESYKVESGGVVEQRLVGWTTLDAEENILSGTQKFPAGITVRNADNDEVFSPTFKLWLEGNEDNYGPEDNSAEDGTILPAKPVDKNKVTADGDNEVTVSAGTNFNVQLKKNGDMSYKNWFDFSTGQLVDKDTQAELDRLAYLEANYGKSNPADFVEENGTPLDEETKAKYQNYRYGRITCYGIALQLYTDAENDSDRAAKGVKGMSLPVGDITFDLNLYSEAYSGKDSNNKPIPVENANTEYTAILWDYNENVPAHQEHKQKYDDPGRGENGLVKTPNDGKGNGGRMIYWDGETRSSYAKGGAPSWFMGYFDGCYYGGDWALVDEGGNKVTNINDIATPTAVTGTGKDATYHFSVNDYDFDFDSQHFPYQDAGNSGTVTGYDTYARCFSAGCIQVLSVFPRVQKEPTTELFLNVEVKNLQLVTRVGQELKPLEGDPTKINHEVNQKDNTKRDQVVLYAPGNLTKGNSFNGKHNGKEPNSTNEGYLGTDYWTTSYDCSAFAGDDIWLMSYGMISSGSDYRMRSMNLLQLFDSRALSIRGKPYVYQNYNEGYDKIGDLTFLYAADPDYKDGYDTNKDGVLAYMNTVREEDLVYSENMPDEDGYITVDEERMKCIGVLMEMRGCDLLGGQYQYMRIPVKVNGDDKDLVGKTVATVNTFRVWSKDLVDKEGKPITWAKGKWNPTNGKNELAEYEPPLNRIEGDVYSGEMANRSENKSIYIKTEYENGHQVTGTHSGGIQSGNSLLILSYKAHVNIAVDKKGSTGSISYDQGRGETIVDYRLKNIKTELSDRTGQSQNPTTTLTVRAELDTANDTDRKDRISVASNSYYMKGYAVGDDEKISDKETDIAISSDPDHPTRLAFKDSNGKLHLIKVYAQPGVKSVSFVVQDAPVGIQLPDITFQANFSAVTHLANNDTITTKVYISGAGDNRAYDQAKGNMDNVTVGVIMRGGTNLTKEVSTKHIELDGTITYTVSYTNSGTDMLRKIYFYDLLPHTKDIRGSQFEGKVILRSFNVVTEGSGNPASAIVYYSTTEYTELYDKVKVFGGTMDDNGTVSGMDEKAVEKLLDGENDTEGNRFLTKLGHVVNGKFVYETELGKLSEEAKTELMSKITGLYVKAEELKEGQTIKMTFRMQTQDNKAGDQYKNIANSWIVDSKTQPLTSNKVETAAISRSISGVVWHDKNLNGVRDTGEPLLDGVTVTLFKKGADDKYVLCEKDVTGSKIEPVITKNNGAYAFENLAAVETVEEANGQKREVRLDYIVAFSGDALKKYTGAATYQVGGGNKANTNDGMALTDLNLSDIDTDEYLYAIKYSAEHPEIKPSTLEEIARGGATLTNWKQEFTNQDLGVIIAGPELPNTGGEGVEAYLFSGFVLMAGAALLLCKKIWRKEEKWL